jgi:hypothetical protein
LPDDSDYDDDDDDDVVLPDTGAVELPYVFCWSLQLRKQLEEFRADLRARDVAKQSELLFKTMLLSWERPAGANAMRGAWKLFGVQVTFAQWLIAACISRNRGLKIFKSVRDGESGPWFWKCQTEANSPN